MSKTISSQILFANAFDEEAMPSLRLARSSRNARRVAKFLFISLMIILIFMIFTPWQQSVTGTGNVIAYAPLERQQIIESPIKGRIVRWGEGIVENTRVVKGQFITEISDLDENYTLRIQDQLKNSELQVRAAKDHVEASQSVYGAAKSIIGALEGQLRAYKNVKSETEASLEAYIQMTENKVQAEEQQLVEYQSALPQIEAELNRVKQLHEEGNIALQKLQEVERKWSEYNAKVSKAKAYVEAAKSELQAKKRERQAKLEKAQGDIEYAEASLRKAQGDISKAQSDMAKSQQEQNKAEKELSEMQIKVSRQQNQIILAPFDGYIVRIVPNIGTAVLKEGDSICTIVPDTEDRAVQIWLDGNDAPLVTPNNHVRLQFEGWPAVQFSGWPSIARGTFGGKVVSVDAVDNGVGKFRVLVQPDLNDEPWPDESYLRQGVRANGWVMLKTVPLWYEVWRRLNSFPPVISHDKSPSKEEKSKPPKLPK